MEKEEKISLEQFNTLSKQLADVHTELMKFGSETSLKAARRNIIQAIRRLNEHTLSYYEQLDQQDGKSE